MEYKLVRSARKTLALKIDSNGEVFVLSPKKCSLDYINKFVISKLNWIKKHQETITKRKTENEDFFKLNKILIFGSEYEIIDKSNHYQIGEFYVKHTKASKKEIVLKKFLNGIAREYILPKTQEIAQAIGLNYKSAEIISARKKWGSCNNLKQLKFNFRLSMLPKELINYVICHELCHLKQMNHSKEFWGLLEKLGYKKSDIKARFKSYAFVLQLL